MKIVLLEDLENKSLIKILDNDELVRVFDKKLYFRHLRKIRNFLSREEVEAFFQLEEGKIALRYVYNLLSIKDYTKPELERKLREKRISSRVIHEVLERVEELGYLRDEDILKKFIESELRKGHGPAWIRVRLAKKLGEGKRGEIEALLKASLPDALQKEKIQELIGKKGKKEKEKLYRFLKSRGFEDRLILPLLKKQGLESIY